MGPTTQARPDNCVHQHPNLLHKTIDLVVYGSAAAASRTCWRQRVLLTSGTTGDMLVCMISTIASLGDCCSGWKKLLCVMFEFSKLCFVQAVAR
jgi:hypothetical protein